MPEARSDGPRLDRETVERMLDRVRVTSGDGFKLKRYPTDDPAKDLVDAGHADLFLQQGVARLAGLQELLWAHGTWSVLLVFQAMDAAGKDGTISHVMSGINPQGIGVTAFKAPGPEDLAQDFLWRANRALPARGMIAVFNRSHYEDVLITRVHPEILQRERLPPERTGGRKFWEHRLQDIATFERHLVRQGTIVLKFFLHVGRDEQKRRFLQRLDDPRKTWKFDPGDLAERRRWDDYMAAYEAAIAATATTHAPWFVVPADRKWFMRLLVVEAITEAIARLDLQPVVPDLARVAAFAEARRQLEQE